MNMIVRACAVMALFVLAACTTVSSVHPVGVAKGEVKDERIAGSYRFVGDKDSGNDAAFAFILAPDTGGLKGVLVVPGDNDYLELELVAGKAGVHDFLNVHPLKKNGEEPEGSDKLDGYMPFRYVVGADGSVQLYLWSQDKLKDAVEKGALKGTSTQSAITMTAEPAELDAFFAKNGAEFFAEPFGKMVPLK